MGSKSLHLENRRGALALVYSAAEYASPAWCRSAHSKKLDITLNETMRIVTGCLKPPGIVRHCTGAAALRRENYTHILVSKASQDPNHLLHKLVSDSQDLGRQRLPSRRPFSRHSASIAGSDYNTLQAWRTSWQQTPRPPQLSVTPNTRLPPGADLPRKDWTTLNRLRTGVGRFNANMHRWGLRPSPNDPTQRSGPRKPKPRHSELAAAA